MEAYRMKPTMIFALLAGIALPGCDNNSPPGPAPAQGTSQSTEPTKATKISLAAASNSIRDMATSTTCNIEEIGGKNLSTPSLKIGLGQDVTVAGWVIDKAGETDGGTLAIRLVSLAAPGGEYEITRVSRTPRPDVRSAMGGNSAYENSGFNAVIPAKSLTPGPYNIGVVYQSKGKPVVCGEGNYFEVE